MLHKVLEDIHCDFDVSLAWCLNAKNSLQNVHGFSLYQLALGQNPVLPTVLSDKLPALTPTRSSNIICANLNALHAARPSHRFRKGWAASAPKAQRLLYSHPPLSTEASMRVQLSCRITSCGPHKKNYHLRTRPVTSPCRLTHTPSL